MPDQDFTEDEIREIWRVFDESSCTHCGGAHARACPRVKRLEFHQNGTIMSAEFWPPGKWPDDAVQWPEDLPPRPGSDL